MAMIDVTPQAGEAHGELSGGPVPPVSRRPPRVLIAPAYENPRTRARFADTLASDVIFTESPVRETLTADELTALLLLHVIGRARFWGAVSRYDSDFDQLATGDVVLFTGQRRVQAVAGIGCRLRNPSLADTLWTPEPERGSWTNVYSVLGFRPDPGLSYADIHEAAGYDPRRRLPGNPAHLPGQVRGHHQPPSPGLGSSTGKTARPASRARD